MKVKEIKHYTLKEWKEFCKEALTMPPFEDDEQIDEWFDTHKIHIITNDCDIELEYDADTINEIEFSLREIYEAIHGSGVATTGNTVGSEYRPATIVDLMVVYIDRDMTINRSRLNGAIHSFIKWFDLKALEDTRQAALKYSEYAELLQCDFAKLDMSMGFPYTKQEREDLVKRTLCTNYEVSYDSSTDRSYIVDFTFTLCGALVGFTWGSSESDIQSVIDNYKDQMLS